MAPQYPIFAPLLEETRPHDRTLPAFMVSTTRGFLPRQDPLAVLPSEFSALEELLQAMPIRTKDGKEGLLALNKLGETVDTSFPNLVEDIEKYKDDQVVLTALYRDYSFLASAYLLEPCHHEYLSSKGKGYGLGRQVLPENISLPISKVAELTGFMPFMEYSGSYALANYRLLDPEKPLTYDNIALIRAFEHGLDRTSSEAGFVLVHVAMVRHSGAMVAGASAVLTSAGNQDRQGFNDGLRTFLSGFKLVNETMDSMWQKSKPGDYTSFRTFIFGITSQSMFPNGVIYKGINNNEPMSFRGESGANDSMVPLCDNLLEIEMPNTPLTEILKDFRKYRPGNHRGFLEYVAKTSRAVGVRKFAEMDEESLVLYLLCLDQVREFRWRHWCFTREYILKKTAHPTATGGSPIVHWLPNQLFAVLAAETIVLTKLKERDHWTKEVAGVDDIVDRQTTTLEKEVEKFCTERGLQKK